MYASMLRRAIDELRIQAGRFRADARGQITILFGLSLTAVTLAVGGGVDLGRAYQAKQKLSEVATLTCQYASRPSVIQTIAPSYTGANGATTYASNVQGYINAALVSQQFGWTQTTGTPFTFTVNGPADVTLTANVPTAFMRVMSVSQLPVGATAHCYDSSANLQQTLPNSGTPYVVQEGFERNTCGGAGTCTAYYSIPGHSRSTASSSVSTTPTYTGSTGGTWYGTGYCLETNAIGSVNSSVPEGSRSAELDCDDGSASVGNSAISSKTYLPAGNYELRYFYRSRVSYPDYNPTYVCGSAAADVSWANSTNSQGGPVANALRTNQANVYLDLNTTGSPPLHTTIDGTQQLAGSNLIDVCVYSLTWIERSVRIYVTNPGFYWLTFAADGQNDSYGAQIDNIRLCPETCPGTLQDNFPAAWLAANNGGVNKVLFEDTFESPTYSGTYHGIANTSGNLNVSYGTSGSTSGWPNQATSGWATAPYNEIVYLVSSSAEGAQSLQFDSTTPSNGNHLASRPFLLAPGYYKFEYRYAPDIFFSSLSGTYCGPTPSAANVSTLSGSAAGTDRFLGSAVTLNRDTNLIGVFMAHASLASTPNGGGALNSTTSYTNPNGSTTTTPTVAPNGLSLTSYNAAQPNPLLDICGYATSWQTRTAYVKIQKPAYYWLTISALGTGDGYGGAVDDVKLTALGSLYMASPPASPVTIPVPDPQPDTRTYFTGFYIVTDPLLPTAPLQ